MPSYLAHKIANGLVAMKRVEPVTGAYADVYKNIWHFRNTTTGNEWWDFTNENEVLTGAVYKTLNDAVKGMDALLKELTGDEAMTTLNPLVVYVKLDTRKQYRCCKTEEYANNGIDYAILHSSDEVLHVAKCVLAKDYIPLDDLVKVAEIPEPGGTTKPINHRDRIGKFYRNNNSGTYYVVKDWKESTGTFVYSVIGSGIEYNITLFALDAYYTEVPPVTHNMNRLAEDDKTETYIREILKRIEGTDTLREGLVETPARVAKAFGHWFGGYQVNVADLFKAFEDGAENCDEMVVVRDIPFYSHCEHHMAAIMGTATVGYIPNGKIVGLSKLNRVVDAFARRLQVQERLTTQIAEAIQEHLQPLGVGVRIQARHMCMESRGVCQSGHSTVTTKMTGVMRTNAEARHEFLDNCK